MEEKKVKDGAYGSASIRGLILDFGGTIDTNGCHWGKMLWHAYQQVGIPVQEDEFREAYVYGERQLEKSPLIQPDYTFKKTIDIKLRLELEQLCIMGAWDADETALRQAHGCLLECVYELVSITILHSRDVLDALHERYPMILVTNFYGNMRQVLREFQLENLFVDVIESAVVNIRKPDVRILKMAIERLGIGAHEVMAIGDSFYKDVEPAAKLGCKTAWLKGEGWTDRQYDETLPTHVLTDFCELRSLL